MIRPSPARADAFGLDSEAGLYSDTKSDETAMSAMPRLGSFSISLALFRIQHVLFQKSDGTYLIALWQGVRSANEAALYQNLSVQPRSVSIYTATTVRVTLIFFAPCSLKKHPGSYSGR
jgi:hypothetical protein